MSSVVCLPLIFVIGSAVSLGASVLLVSRLERVAVRLGLSEAILGLVAALAADSPEIASAVTAMLRHQRDIGVGVVFGSNVFNLAALLGLGAIVSGRLALHRRVVILAGSVALWCALVSVGTTAGLVLPTVGLVLVALVLAPYIVVSAASAEQLLRFRAPRRWMSWLHAAVLEEEQELAEAIQPTAGTMLDALVASLAVLAVVIASAAMEYSAASLGTRYSVSGVIVGGLVLAAVTSLPNAVTAVYLARRGRGAAVLSEAMNSNTLNVAAGLLVPAALLGLGQPSGLGLFGAASYAALTVAALGMAYAGRGMGRVAGGAVIAAYLAYVGVLLLAGR